MGLKNFNKFLRDTCPDVFEDIHISEYGFKRVAIDISLYLNKYKAIAGENWLASFVKLVACLRRNNIHCVFIFDGKSPPEKQGERARRHDNREKMEKQLYELEEAFDEYHKTGIIADCLANLYARRRSPSAKRLLKKPQGVDMAWVERKIEQKRNQLYSIAAEDYEKAKELFNILRVPYYIAPWEAEKMCSKLCLDNKVCAVLSEDTDVMAYGTPIFLTKLDTGKDVCVRLRHDILLENLELTKEQFLDLCIMCGTDYNDNIPRVGSKTAYKRILQHGGIDGIAKDTNWDVSILKHVRVRQLFTEFEDYGIDSIPYCGKPDFEKLEEFITKNNTKLNIEKLKNDFVQKIVVIEDEEDDSE